MNDMDFFCRSLCRYSRRRTDEVCIGGVTIGGDNPVAVQTMTNTDTLDTGACSVQIEEIYRAGGRIVRLTAQGLREAENLENISRVLREAGMQDMALVADIHFLPGVALVAAEHVDKVRINPGNYRDEDGHLFRELLGKCKKMDVAIRIGVNHGSLSPEIMDRYGDTPEGMVVSAMRFLHICREEDFPQVVVSMKSSNVRVMVHAYRMLAAAMAAENMRYPLHLGVTEAGDGEQGRVKSSVGIGTLLADGIGDTIRVSLTEHPRNEIPVAMALAGYFSDREGSGAECPSDSVRFFHPYEYVRRETDPVCRAGGPGVPLLFGELDEAELAAVREERIAVVESTGENPVGEWRAMILGMSSRGDRRPVILRRRYAETDLEILRIKAAADFGPLFVDGLADGIDIINEAQGDDITSLQTESLALAILQASRVRISRTEYIACPGCGRTLYDLEETLSVIKERTSHLKGLKIGVMGCIVNGPGEMADADYGYVGSGRGRITLYKGKEVVRRDIPQDQATDALIELIKDNGEWMDPDAR